MRAIDQQEARVKTVHALVVLVVLQGSRSNVAVEDRLEFGGQPGRFVFA